MPSIRTTLTTVAAVGAVGAAALGGTAIANAAGSSSTTTTPSATTTTAGKSGHARSAQRDPSKGGHQANGKTETLLTGDTAAKVKAAALAKLRGATVLRIETDADSSNPYEAHVEKADGTEVQVSVDASFTVVSVNAMGHR